jgi:hypothetical protein
MSMPLSPTTARIIQVRWLLDKCDWGAVTAATLRAAKSLSISSRIALSWRCSNSLMRRASVRRRKSGRPSIPPEKLLRALLMQAFYSVRSERQLVEQLDDNLLFRWLVGLSRDAVVRDVTVLTKNRARLIAGEIAGPVHGGSTELAAGQGAALGRAFLGRRQFD